MYKKIDKRQARKLWAANQPFTMCGNKVVPDSPLTCSVYRIDARSISEYKDRAAFFASLDKPETTVDASSLGWEYMYNNFMFHLDAEEGRYPAFYIDKA